MVVPRLEATPAGTTQMSAYFPNGNWVSLKDYSNIITGANKDEMIPIPMAGDTVNAYIRPGHMVAKQPNSGTFMTTSDVLNNAETHLVINRDD